MKVRAKITSRMNLSDRIWIVKNKIYELKEYDEEHYVFESEIDNNHSIRRDEIKDYFYLVPNICEVLGVGVEQLFNIKGIACNPCKIQDNTYYVVDSDNEVLHAKHLLRAINDISLIEKIKYTDEQKEIFKALKLLGYNYIARDQNYSIFAFEKKPIEKFKPCWRSNGGGSIIGLETDKIAPHLNFINWSDEEPFEIPEVI